MADLTQMLDLNNIGTSGQLAGTGAVIGMAVGGVPGAAIGAGVGTVVANFVPQYTHVKGSVTGINFVTVGLKPYHMKLYEPDDNEAKAISDYYCYFGCKTSRTEALNITGYIYQNHAYIRGSLHYNGSIPLDKFQKLQNIFKNGVHIIDT